MFRITIFIIALLLVTGTVDPTRNWLVTLTVLSGLHLFRFRPWRMFGGHSERHHWRWSPRRWIEEPDW